MNIFKSPFGVVLVVEILHMLNWGEEIKECVKLGKLFIFVLSMETGRSAFLAALQWRHGQICTGSWEPQGHVHEVFKFFLFKKFDALEDIVGFWWLWDRVIWCRCSGADGITRYRWILHLFAKAGIFIFGDRFWGQMNK